MDSVHTISRKEEEAGCEEKAMPRINPATLLQIGLLLSAVPVQYFISRYFGTDSTERLELMQRITLHWSDFRQSYLSPNVWIEQVNEWISNVRLWYYRDEIEKEAAESYFAESTDVRSPKPSFVKFSVGQMVVHKQFGYSGVITGWDPKVRAPEDWLKETYSSEKEIEVKKNIPHYRILICRPQNYGKTISYIAQDEVIVLKGLQLYHPVLHIYFSMFEGSRYVMHPWLQRIYPHDD
ncbi:uncharacterized protein LOC115465226 [Microcaecilia unicolor]|uniref:Uncharacterized protein LOC115465226 n=1 Tax=Microcaecilia unicolor TaxID=1415580 RepID=A0A6P7XMA2_9AMPH|nr:uncharacterized protein LOC115465226 [Microcaecilia unicolor]